MTEFDQTYARHTLNTCIGNGSLFLLPRMYRSIHRTEARDNAKAIAENVHPQMTPLIFWRPSGTYFCGRARPEPAGAGNC